MRYGCKISLAQSVGYIRVIYTTGRSKYFCPDTWALSKPIALPLVFEPGQRFSGGARVRGARQYCCRECKWLLIFDFYEQSAGICWPWSACFTRQSVPAPHKTRRRPVERVFDWKARSVFRSARLVLRPTLRPVVRRASGSKPALANNSGIPSPGASSRSAARRMSR